MPELNRREFVIATGAAVCAGIVGCVSKGGQVWTGPMTFELPEPGQIKDGIDQRWLLSGGFFLVRRQGRIYAVTSTCTHMACTLTASSTQYICPCHGSHFTAAGKVLQGPAAVALPRFGISLSEAGHLYVDRNKVFGEGQWEENGAFVKA